MTFYEVVAMMTAAAALLAFATRRGKANSDPASGDRIHQWTTVASSLVVAIVVLAGLVSLASEHFTETRYSQQAEMDHSSAIQNIYFRH